MVSRRNWSGILLASGLSSDALGVVSRDIEKAKATPPEGFIPNPKLKLLDQVSEAMRSFRERSKKERGRAFTRGIQGVAETHR